MTRLLSLFFCLALLCCSSWANAQQSNLLRYSPHFELNSSRYAPATFGGADHNFYFSVPYISVWGGNSAISKKQVLDIISGGQIETALVNDIVDGLHTRNYLTAGADFSPFIIGFTLKKDDKESLSVQLGVTDQASAKLVFSDRLAQLAWYGNKQFAGKSLDLGPLAATAVYRRELFFGVAAPVFHNRDLDIRIGAKAKVLHGLAGANMENINATFYTSSTGDEIRLETDFVFRSAGLEEFNPMQAAGNGWGIDLGASFSFLETARADVSIIDLGGINFDQGVVTYSTDASLTFEGFVIEGTEIDQSGLDSVLQSFEIKETEGGNFRIPNSTRAVVHISYAIEQFSISKGSYPAHNFHFYFEQGFQELDRSGIAPVVGLSYNYNLFDIFSIGVSTEYALNQFKMGAFTSVKGGPFRFGIGSSNIGGLSIGSQALGTDFTMLMEFAF